MKHTAPPRKVFNRQGAYIIRRHGVIMLRGIAPALWAGSALAI
ncbi:MAG: hypothetical protein [Bacteriophage sp.]|nr:MAG: hypothetical protein [Bacteriophage sp.]